MQAGREIKFRGKRIDNGEWVYGNLVLTAYGCYIIPQNIYADRMPQFSVDPKTVGQFIGFRGKNEREIFEGDILQYPDAYQCGEDWEETLSVGEIEWDENQAQFTVSNRQSIDLESLFDDIDEAEVIGNIYENPELLEVVK